MNKIILTGLFLLSISTAFAEEINLTVNGMVCSFCAQGIKKNLSKVEGIIEVKPNLEAKNVYIKTDDKTEVTNEKLKSIIVDAGYELVKVERGAK